MFFRSDAQKKMADEAAKQAGEHLPNIDRPCHHLPALMQIGTIESHSGGARQRFYYLSIIVSPHLFLLITYYGSQYH